MNKKQRAVRTAPKSTAIIKMFANTKVENGEEICKNKGRDFRLTLEYFRKHIGTSLDCAFETGILRNSITRYIQHLERAGLLRVMYNAPDSRTGHQAKHYSANPANWYYNNNKKLNGNEEAKE